MLKGFLGGFAISTLMLIVLSLAVPLTPDPAAGSPAPAPVVLPLASSAPSGPDSVVAPVQRPADGGQMPSAAVLPAGLPAMRNDQSPAQTSSEVPSLAGSGKARPQPPLVMLISPVAGALPNPQSAPAYPAKATTTAPSPQVPAPLVDITLRTDRLPQIGVPRPSGPAREGRSPARERYAMAVGAMPGDQPRVALLLLHENDLPNLPVTLVFDPLDPDAPETARAWRAGGGEVAILASGLPPGADARDAEVTLQSHLRLLPEAVALVDLPEGGFARDRILSAQTIAILAEDGHGLVTHGNGLNAPVRMAESAGVAALTVAAHITSDASPTTTRRLLDRIALRAAQDDHAVIFGTASPEVIGLISDWLENGRGRDLVPVPLSVLLNGR